MRLRLFFLVLLTLILAACTSSNGENGPLSDVAETSQPEATEAVPTVEDVITPSALACEDLPEVTTSGEGGVTVPENAVAVFQKSGGFAGINERTVIYADGRIENDKNESFQGSTETISMLVSSAADAGFFDMERNYVPEDHCCDFFNYSLTIRDCDQVNTVMTADEIPGAPTELMELIHAIQDLIANLSA